MTTHNDSMDLEAYRRVLEALRRRIPKPQFETWFARTRLLRMAATDLVLAVPNQFQQEWMTREYRGPVAAATEDALGHRLEVRFEVAPMVDGKVVGPESLTPQAAAPSAPTGNALFPTSAGPVSITHVASPTPTHAPVPTSDAFGSPPSAPSSARGGGASSPSSGSSSGTVPFAVGSAGGLLLQPRYTFEDFVVGPSNQMAHAAARAVADDPGTTNNPLFLYGAVGLGKTHLLQAICHEILRRRPGFRVAYMSCEQFTNEYVSAVQRNATEAFRNRFRNVDMLVIDDIHFLANKERTQEEFFHTFNALYQMRKQLILSSDAPPADIPTLEERLVSRFKWGLVEKLEQPETETRMAIIRRKAEGLSLHLPDDVVEFVANNVRNNIREIEGAITSVRSRSMLERAPVDLTLAKAALEATLRHDQPAVGIEKIAQVVSAHYGVKVTDLRSKKRTKSISLPRQVVMYLAREETGLSLVEIGAFFGGRDHTTVLYATTRIADLVAREDAFRAQVERWKDRLRAR